MITSFIDNFSSKLAERWSATLFIPAFIFWTGGLIAWLNRDKSQINTSWKTLENWFSILPISLQYALLVGSLFLIATSALVIQQFDLLVIRSLEGYWPCWLNRFHYWLVKQQLSERRRLDWRFQVLNKKRSVGLTTNELDKYWESYWPKWLRYFRNWLKPIRHLLAKRHQARIHQVRKKLKTLRLKQAQLQGVTSLTAEEWIEYQSLSSLKNKSKFKHQFKGLAIEELLEYSLLEQRLRQFPPQDCRVMPTRLGNLLSAAESRSSEKYGLDSIICWPSLWLVLPDSTKAEIQIARANLNEAARAWFWSLLFVSWSIWKWWAAIVGLFSAFFIYYYWLLNTAIIYGQLIEAAFDTHRTKLL